MYSTNKTGETIVDDSRRGSFASNLEQVDTVCSGQLSLLSSAGWEMSSSLRATATGEGLLWPIGAVVCLQSASCKSRVQLFTDAGNGWPHSALQYH